MEQLRIQHSYMQYEQSLYRRKQVLPVRILVELPPSQVDRARAAFTLSPFFHLSVKRSCFSARAMPLRAKRGAAPKQPLVPPDSEDDEFVDPGAGAGDFAPAPKKRKATAAGKKGKARAPRAAKLTLFVQMPLDLLNDVRFLRRVTCVL